MALTREQVNDALEAVVVDGTPLPQSGRLSAIVVEGGRVSLSISALPSEAARMENVRAAAEAAIQRLAGAERVFVSLTADRPAGAGAPAGASARPSTNGGHAHGHDHGHAHGPRGGTSSGGAPASRQAVPGIKSIIAVASGKGGVGKSTLSCNLALSLKRQGLSVGLLDADIYGPSAPKLFGLSGKPRLIGPRMLEPLDGYGVKVMSIGFLVEEESPMIWRGPMVMSAVNQLLREVAWGELDVLVVDMPPGTGDAQLTMAQSTPLAGAVIVSTPQDLALIDARRGIAMFKKVEVPIIGIVENMSTFICPHCGTPSDIFGHGGARAEAERLGAPFLGEVPLVMSIRETSDAGRPVVVSQPDGPEALAYAAIADGVRARLAGGTGARPAPRIVIE